MVLSDIGLRRQKPHFLTIHPYPRQGSRKAPAAKYFLGRTAVVYDGKIIGQDPDANVRLDFRKNSDFYSGGQP